MNEGKVMNMFSGQGMLIRAYMYLMNATILRASASPLRKTGYPMVASLLSRRRKGAKDRVPWRTGVDLASFDGISIHI
jgi:hypothetical protein